MLRNSATQPLYKTIIKRNKNAKKVLFFITSYMAPWSVYRLIVRQLQCRGYEVIVYDINDYILNNKDPHVLLLAINEINTDIHAKVLDYQKAGITIFDGIGNSLGSFLMYNYAICYPLRKVILNIGGYMSRVVFLSKDWRVARIRKNYERIGLNMMDLNKLWVDIDSPTTAKRLKCLQILLFTSRRDVFVSNESANELIRSLQKTPVQITVHINKYLGHTLAVIKNVHSRKLKLFLEK
jgi:hypothetical protein